MVGRAGWPGLEVDLAIPFLPQSAGQQIGPRAAGGELGIEAAGGQQRVGHPAPADLGQARGDDAVPPGRALQDLPAVRAVPDVLDRAADLIRGDAQRLPGLSGESLRALAAIAAAAMVTCSGTPSQPSLKSRPDAAIERAEKSSPIAIVVMNLRPSERAASASASAVITVVGALCEGEITSRTLTVITSKSKARASMALAIAASATEALRPVPKTLARRRWRWRASPRRPPVLPAQTADGAADHVEQAELGALHAPASSCANVAVATWLAMRPLRPPSATLGAGRCLAPGWWRAPGVEARCRQRRRRDRQRRAGKDGTAADRQRIRSGHWRPA
jgi:hypothetical protein